MIVEQGDRRTEVAGQLAAMIATLLDVVPQVPILPHGRFKLTLHVNGAKVAAHLECSWPEGAPVR